MSQNQEKNAPTQKAAPPVQHEINIALANVANQESATGMVNEVTFSI